jgi:hypothetical protein
MEFVCLIAVFPIDLCLRSQERDETRSVQRTERVLVTRLTEAGSDVT